MFNLTSVFKKHRGFIMTVIKFVPQIGFLDPPDRINLIKLVETYLADTDATDNHSRAYGTLATFTTISLINRSTSDLDDLLGILKSSCYSSGETILVNIVRDIESALRRSGIDPEIFEVELTNLQQKFTELDII